MNKENKTYLYAPKGEWLSSFKIALSNAGVRLNEKPRSYLLEPEDSSIPISFEITRSKDVIASIADPDTIGFAGFTGSDIYAEQVLRGITPSTPIFDQDEYPTNSYQTSALPLNELDENSPKPQLYLGSTPRLREAISSPTAADIKNGTIYTSYPTITSRYFAKRGINSVPVKVKSRAGSIEGKWITDPTNVAIVDIKDTGTTSEANEIEVIDTLMQVQLLLVISEAISQRDRLRVNDFQELLYQAARRRA